MFILVFVDAGSVAEQLDGCISADSSEPYVTQLANQLLAFASLENVDDLAPDDLADLVLVMARAAEKLESQTGFIAARAHRRGVGKHVGSSSTGAWLAHKTGVIPAHAHRMIRRAETEGMFGRFAFAHDDGKITGFHLDHLGQVWRNHRDLEDLLLRDEVMLCDAACRLSPAEFGLVCQKWLSLADPDGSYDKFLRNLERRFLSTARNLDGNIHLAGRLDPITGEAFTRLVDRRASEMFDADWAAAEAASAEGVVLEKGMLRRSDAQRRLDALVSLVVDGSSTPEGAQRPEPMVFFGVDSVTFEEFLADMLNNDLGDTDLDDTDLSDTVRDDTDHHDAATKDGGGAAERPETEPDRSRDRSAALRLPDTSAAVDPARRCETGGGFPVPFRVMLQQVLTCQIRRVVYGAPNVIVNAGHTRRLFSPTQRQLIKHRDRTCRFPGCHRDAVYNETDHILAFTHGGPTDLANGQCLCRHHHQLKSRGRFFCDTMPDGRTGFFLPTGIQIE